MSDAPACSLIFFTRSIHPVLSSNVLGFIQLAAYVQVA